MEEHMIDCLIDNMTMEQTAAAINKTFGTTITRNAVLGKWRRFVENRFGGPQ